MSVLRLPCTPAQLEQLRTRLLEYQRLAERLEREQNALGAATVSSYTAELAQLLTGDRLGAALACDAMPCLPSSRISSPASYGLGLQGRVYYWHREGRRRMIGHRSRRRPRTKRRGSQTRRRTRVVMIPGIYRGLV